MPGEQSAGRAPVVVIHACMKLERTAARLPLGAQFPRGWQQLPKAAIAKNAVHDLFETVDNAELDGSAFCFCV